MDALRRTLRMSLVLGCLYAGCVALGLVLMVLAFRLGVFRSLDILFYRGLVVIACVFVLLFAAVAAGLRRARISGLASRDAFAAAVVSLSVNLSFLVVVPVTVDRSISIFVLGQMAAHPDARFTSEEMSALFTKLYVGDRRQIDRRLREQDVSGNVEKVGDGYRISPRGRSVVEAARLIETLFDSHAGLIAPRAATSAGVRASTAP